MLDAPCPVNHTGSLPLAEMHKAGELRRGWDPIDGAASEPSVQDPFRDVASIDEHAHGCQGGCLGEDAAHVLLLRLTIVSVAEVREEDIARSLPDAGIGELD